VSRVPSTQCVEVAVIGAGPYGLSVAAHLHDARVEALALGEPMSSWQRHMPRGMYLKSTLDASSLSAPQPGSSLADFHEATGAGIPDERHPVPLETFVDYGRWFQRKHVGGLVQCEVQRLTATQDRFSISLSNGEEIGARSVIVASGHVGHAYLPEVFRRFARHENGGDKRISHACQHRDFSGFLGRSVAVIGAGQSALESAALLCEAGAEVHLVARRQSIRWGGPPIDPASSPLRPMLKPASPLGPGWSLFALSRAPSLVSYLPASFRIFVTAKVLGPSGAWWLRDRFSSEINVALDSEVEGLASSGERVILQLWRKDGSRSTLAVDHVIAATGYRVDVDTIGLMDSGLRAAVARVKPTGAPRLSRSFESSIRGLHFIGLAAAPTFGSLMRFVCGAEFAAMRVRRALTGKRLPRNFQNARVTMPRGPDAGAFQHVNE
jgi:thioredoxin reductase